MHLIFADATGQTFEGIVLATSRHHMRVVVKGLRDTVGLVYSYGHWATEEGRSVEIGAVVVGGWLPAELPLSVATVAC